MDSRVAGYITEVLYEIQRANFIDGSDEPSEEEKHSLPRIYGDDELEPQSPLGSSEAFDPTIDESTSEAINGTVEEIGNSNGTCTLGRKRKISESSSKDFNHEPENHSKTPPTKKSASAEVKERIRNNILKHDEQAKQQNHGKPPNGMLTHKMNGTDSSHTLHVNDLRKATSGEHSASTTTSNATSPGSMTAVA